MIALQMHTYLSKEFTAKSSLDTFSTIVWTPKGSNLQAIPSSQTLFFLDAVVFLRHGERVEKAKNHKASQARYKSFRNLH